MPKDKDKTLNPAAAHLKSEKARALKKSKAQQTTQRNEKLARRNPDRLQRQIDELKATQEAQGGQLRPRDRQQLEQLDRDVKAIRKAREATGGAFPDGDKPPRSHDSQNERGRDSGARGRGRGRGGSTTLGKRPRSPFDDGPESDETDPEVRDIPMPRDTPPPMPRRQPRNTTTQTHQGPHPLPAKPQTSQTPVQTTYEAKPQLRDLQKEATSKFVPAAVAARLKQRSGGGGRLLEPEEVDALERGGYLDAKRAADEAAKEEAYAHVAGGRAADGDEGDLDAEEAAFQRELALAEGEEDDDDGPRDALAKEAKRDAKRAVDEAVGEAQRNMLQEEEQMGDTALEEDARAETHLRHVEIEEIEDEDLQR